MKLRDLEGRFYKWERQPCEVTVVVGDPATWEERGRPTETKVEDRDIYVPVDTLDEADGVQFLCPKCFAENGGPKGTHRVLCWFVGLVPDEVDPKPGRWNPSGTSLDDLTFIPPGAVSVQLLGGCNWHGFVREGDAT